MIVCPLSIRRMVDVYTYIHHIDPRLFNASATMVPFGHVDVVTQSVNVSSDF